MRLGHAARNTEHATRLIPSLPPPAKPAIQPRMDSREAFIALNMIERVGPVRVRQLLEHPATLFID